MLGSYDQNALSGAATVNQIFFVVNQLAIAIGNALIVMSSQYWGKKDTYAIRKLTGIVLIFSLLAAMIILVICSAFPEQLLGLFTTSPDIIMEGQTYLKILKWTFCLISDQQSSDLHAEKCGDSTDFICCFCDISDRKRRN